MTAPLPLPDDPRPNVAPTLCWIVGEADDHIEGVYEDQADAQRAFERKHGDALHDSGHSSWWCEPFDYFPRAPLAKPGVP